MSIQAHTSLRATFHFVVILAIWWIEMAIQHPSWSSAEFCLCSVGLKGSWICGVKMSRLQCQIPSFAGRGVVAMCNYVVWNLKLKLLVPVREDNKFEHLQVQWFWVEFQFYSAKINHYLQKKTKTKQILAIVSSEQFLFMTFMLCLLLLMPYTLYFKLKHFP